MAKSCRMMKPAHSPLAARTASSFQGYNLFPHLTALENVALPLRVVHGVAPEQADARAREMLDRLGFDRP